jgi:hypothetical protein
LNGFEHKPTIDADVVFIGNQVTVGVPTAFVKLAVAEPSQSPKHVGEAVIITLDVIGEGSISVTDRV